MTCQHERRRPDGIWYHADGTPMAAAWTCCNPSCTPYGPTSGATFWHNATPDERREAVDAEAKRRGAA